MIGTYTYRHPIYQFTLIPFLFFDLRYTVVDVWSSTLAIIIDGPTDRTVIIRAPSRKESMYIQDRWHRTECEKMIEKEAEKEESNYREMQEVH